MKNFYIDNRTITYIFTFFFLIFNFYIINQYSLILENKDFYRSFLGDGVYHIRLIAQIDNNFTFNKIHEADLYHNNYYLFSLLILKILKFFPGFSYSSIGLAAVIINLISTYLIFIFSYLICFNLSKSKLLSLSLVLLLWNGDLIEYALLIYPDILQLAFIFISVYCLTSQYKYKFFLSVIFSGLAFGVKAQGLLIFLFLISYIFFLKLHENDFRLNKKIILKIFFYCLTFLSSFFILNQISLSGIVERIFRLSKNIYNGNQFTLSELGISNFDIVNNYLLVVLKGEAGVFLLILLIVIGIMLSIRNKHKEKYLFYFSIIFIFFFYIQLISYNKLVQGTRYLYHLFPLILVAISLSYFYISKFLSKRNMKLVSLVSVFFLLFIGLTNFLEEYKTNISKFDFKTIVKNDDMTKAYYFIKKKISFEIENPLICAGHYSLIPLDMSNNIRKSYRHLDFEDLIRSKSCDLIVLDHSTPGRYIWFKNSIEDIIKPKFENFSPWKKRYGKENIEKLQGLIEFILTDPVSGYKVEYYNSKMIVLKKI